MTQANLELVLSNVWVQLGLALLALYGLERVRGWMNWAALAPFRGAWWGLCKLGAGAKATLVGVWRVLSWPVRALRRPGGRECPKCGRRERDEQRRVCKACAADLPAPVRYVEERRFVSGATIDTTCQVLPDGTRRRISMREMPARVLPSFDAFEKLADAASIELETFHGHVQALADNLRVAPIIDPVRHRLELDTTETEFRRETRATWTVDPYQMAGGDPAEQTLAEAFEEAYRNGDEVQDSHGRRCIITEYQIEQNPFLRASSSPFRSGHQFQFSGVMVEESGPQGGGLIHSRSESVFGDAPSEPILPLKRDQSGRPGIETTNTASHVSININATDAESFAKLASTDDARRALENAVGSSASLSDASWSDPDFEVKGPAPGHVILRLIEEDGDPIEGQEVEIDCVPGLFIASYNSLVLENTSEIRFPQWTKAGRPVRARGLEVEVGEYRTEVDVNWRRPIVLQESTTCVLEPGALKISGEFLGCGAWHELRGCNCEVTEYGAFCRDACRLRVHYEEKLRAEFQQMKAAGTRDSIPCEHSTMSYENGPLDPCYFEATHYDIDRNANLCDGHGSWRRPT